MGAAVLCLGIATLDHVFGVETMPQTAQKHRATSYAPVAGGCAATAAVAVARLGGRARLAARLGDDATGAAVVAALEAEGVDCALVDRAAGGVSPLSAVFVDPAGERLIMNFRGAGLADAPDRLTPQAVAACGAALTDTRWPAGAARLAALARAAGVPCVVDGEAPFAGLEDALAAASHVAFSAQGLRAYAGRDDATGAAVVAALEAEGVDCALVDRAAGGVSPLSAVFVDPAGERLIMNFRGAGLADAPDRLTPQALAACGAALTDTRWTAGAARLAALARAAGVPCVVDGEAPFEGLEDALAAASHVAFSAQGLRAYAGRDDLRDALVEARARLSAWLCVTDGAAGVLHADGAGLAHVPAPRVAARDTLGAGDVWHGAFALALAEGRPEPAAVRFASAAAALKCARGAGWPAIPDRASADALAGETACP